VDVLLRVFVLDGHTVDLLRLVGGERHRDPVTCGQIDVAAEIGETPVLLLALVLVVGMACGVDTRPPAARADVVLRRLRDPVADGITSPLESRT
jgi:hypothetical protein